MPAPSRKTSDRRRRRRPESPPATRGDLKLRRHFTEPGVHPYERIEWETRTALIGSPDAPVFEQHGVEVPAFWSQNATNIVAQKYFAYGADDERREHSVRQLIDRVVVKITAEGAAAGYFADGDEAEVFSDELTYLLLHQYASFNSPVWFNIGAEGAPQTASACQPYDALVRTERGLRRIGDLVAENAVGTRVATSQGEAEILATARNGTKEVLEIELNSGHQLEVTRDHLVWRASDETYGKWVQAGELRPGDMLLWVRETPRSEERDEASLDEIAEGALAGWLQTDGFVGQYEQGTNTSLIVEALSINEQERSYVCGLLETVFAGSKVSERREETVDPDVDFRRHRLNGEKLRPFVERWDLMQRRERRCVPERMLTAPLTVVRAYLRSIYQADGYVVLKEDGAYVNVQASSEKLMRGVQALLERLGIFARLRRKRDRRPNRREGWCLSITYLADRKRFSEQIGFVGKRKQRDLDASLQLPGRGRLADKRLGIRTIRSKGHMPVYDIQTSNGEYVSAGLRLHNCFILAVDDTLESIANWYGEEIEIFRRGSGAGVNLSRLRGAGETLSHGGASSGPVTFMRAADASAGTIQSGGRCLAPWQRVYTERGPIAVSELADRGTDFVVLSFDPPAGRYKAKTAVAWKQPQSKELVRIKTDKGAFDLSHDHPVKLSSGDYVEAGNLREGHSLFACSVNISADGYLRVGLRDGQKGKERFHRMIARDLLGVEIEGRAVHHRDGDRFNNAPGNLEAMSQAEHAALHGKETASRGEHNFQLNNYGLSGEANPMHRAGPFWRDPTSSEAYRQRKSEELTARGAAAEMQREAARQRMLNTAFEVVNAGHSIDTFDDYVSGRKVAIGRIPSISKLEQTIVDRFGSYDEFKREVSRANHRVVSVESLGVSEVYDVEVDCPTADDKTPESGHNFVIWPDAELNGSGIAVSNTRRAAKMVILDVDHPDIEDFIWCKAREEDRVRALVAAGFDMSLGSPEGERNLAETTAYQNANNSIRVSDEFMHAVEDDRPWSLISRNDGEPIRSIAARDLFAEIAEAAWRCADPGLQYDSTIQEWHTTPAQGRISASNPCCFIGRTIVETSEGSISFDDLQRTAAAGGQLPRVVGFDLERQLPILTEINHVWVAGHTKRLVEVETENGLKLRCTPEHRFLTEAGEYVAASALGEGERLRGLSCSSADQRADCRKDSIARDRVLVVREIELDSEVPVFDLEAEGTRNFAVRSQGSIGLDSIVVHNSEYLSNDNTSCNLASLNLLRFLDADGNFDVESFRHVTRLVFLAQEITISFADLPTRKIAKNTRDLRQIGIGYTNLGALLMSLGLAYDSDAGREFAAAVTALLTGEAYLHSTRIAERLEPFAHYEANAESVERVLKRHRGAARKLAGDGIGAEIAKAARGSWNEAVRRCSEHGVRNAQAAVLAPTGCLVPSSMVLSDRGLARLDELGDLGGEQWQPLDDLRVQTDEGAKQATQFFINGLADVATVCTERGYKLVGTPQHRIKVAGADGGFNWKHLGDVAPGDWVPLRLGGMIGSPRRVPLPPTPEPYFASRSSFRAPQEMTPALAEFVGYFMGDGSLHARNIRLSVAGEDRDLAVYLAALGKALFNVAGQIETEEGCFSVVFNSTDLTRWWSAARLAKHAPSPGHRGKGWIPHVPAAVRASNDPEVYGSYLRGFAEADGSFCNDTTFTITQASEAFVDELKTLMLALGLPTSFGEQGPDDSRFSTKPHYLLRLVNASYLHRFESVAGFLSERKRRLLASATAVRDLGQQTSKCDRIPLDSETAKELLDSAPIEIDARLRRNILQAARRGVVSRALLSRLYHETGDPLIARMLEFFYDQVKSSDLTEEELTYDLSVPANVTYIANGFISHNTLSFMLDCDTFGIEPDFALVKSKILAGGGAMTIGNRSVVRALARLGYSEAEVESIVAYVEEEVDKGDGFRGPRGSVIAAPHLKSEHYPVFACAVGEGAIQPLGHVRMMAAVQPFLSGGISKTVNVPATASVEEIADLYMQGWKLGLKALAIYRDGSKSSQPLASAKSRSDDAISDEGIERVASLLGDGLRRGERRKLAREAEIVGTKFSLAGVGGYIHVRLFDDGTPGGLFIDVGQAGSTLHGFIRSWSVTMGVALQYGVPLDVLVSKLAFTQFEPAGFTTDPQIKTARSIVDYTVRWLAAKFLDESVHGQLGIHPLNPPAGIADSADDDEVTIPGGEIVPKTEVRSPTKPAAGAQKLKLTAATGTGVCRQCGGSLRRAGTCEVCESCGDTSGCG